MSLNRKELKKHERRLLDGLVAFYYESGYKADALRDPESGGVYEHKLASRLNYELVDGKPPPEFIEAALILESQGYVRRLIRKPDFPVMGIWPTPSGLDRHELLHRSPLGKFWHHLSANWPTILTSVITTLITLAVNALLGGAV